jgi:hypothetical protein
MSQEIKSNNNFSRRAVLGGIGGISLALLPFQQSARALTASSTLISPQDIASATQVAMGYLSARASLSNIDKFQNISAYIDPDASLLLAWEKARHEKFSHMGDAGQWNGKIESVTSTPRLKQVTAVGAEITIAMMDWTEVSWRQIPPQISLTPAEWAIINKSPGKYGVGAPQYQLLDSAFSADHQVKLHQVGGQWKIFQDSNMEIVMLGRSPDWAEPAAAPGTSNLVVSPHTQMPALGANSLGRTFDYMAAVNYAVPWAYGFNPQYSNYDPVDCANFVSQCFIMGGYPEDVSGGWTKNSYNWINNLGLRNWLISSGRGHADSSEAQLGYADIVNFKDATTLQWVHVALVTTPYIDGTKITCHSKPQKNVPLAPYASDPSWGGVEYASTYLYY